MSFGKKAFKTLVCFAFAVTCVFGFKFWFYKFRAQPALAFESNKDLIFGYGLMDAYFRKTNSIYMSYPDENTWEWKSAASKKDSVFFVASESFRSDSLTPELMPEVFKRIDSGLCRYTRLHYSGGHATENGIFSILYGVSPSYYLSARDQNFKSVFLESLKRANYKIYGNASSDMWDWAGAKFMFEGFDEYWEYVEKTPVVNDQTILDQMIKKIDPKQSGFYFSFFYSTHHNYYYPPEFEIYKPALEETYNHFKGDDELKKDREQIYNRYKNSTRFLDYLLGQYLDKIMKIFPNKNFSFFFVGDHGEEFWDEGFLGHSAPKFHNSRTQTPLLVCGNIIHELPVKGKEIQGISSHMDMSVTVLDYLDLLPKDSAKTSSFFHGFSILKNSKPYPFRLISSTGFPQNSDLVAVVNQDQGTQVYKMSNNFETYDLLYITKPVSENLEAKEYLKSVVKQYYK